MTAAIESIKPTDQTALTEIESRLAQMYDAWRRRNEAEIRAFFADIPNLALWGTDQFEGIVGKTEADREFKTWIATCPPWVSMRSIHRLSGLRNGLAWIADEVEGRWVDGDTGGTDFFRMTTVWEEIDGTWLIVHVNAASPR